MFDLYRYFLLVYEHRSITEAARRGHITQPAMTSAVRRLEDALGARLFYRTRAGVEPTSAAEALLPHARAALAAVRDASHAVRELAAGNSGRVRIGGGATVCTYYLPPVLEAFRGQRPGVVLYVREDTSA